jgi:hydroxymethylbilane synthase
MSGLKKVIRIGTRQSVLAMWQANRVKASLESLNEECTYELVPIQTKGDQNISDPISSIGGKGIFLKEIEQALVNNDIDIAVHSFKDITAIPSIDLEYSGFILEEAITDSFILLTNKSLSDDLVIATGSLRRKALIRELYPNIQCVDIRGNVHTRIEKAKTNKLDGLMLSTAGLQRLGLEHLIAHECDPNEFIPAPGQGIIAIQHRVGEPHIKQAIQAITNSQTNALAQQYYTILQTLNFNCDIPFGAYINSSQQLRLFYDDSKAPRFLSIELSHKEGVNQILKDLKRYSLPI